MSATDFSDSSECSDPLESSDVPAQNSKEAILMETAKIPWKELQRFFAAGKLYCLDKEQDLIATAEAMATDNTETIQSLISKNALKLATDQQAIQWTQDDALLWCVVVKPFVIVQEV